MLLYGDYSEQYYIIYLKLTVKVNLKCFYHGKETLIIWGDESVVLQYKYVSNQHIIYL